MQETDLNNGTGEDDLRIADAELAKLVAREAMCRAGVSIDPFVAHSVRPESVAEIARIDCMIAGVIQDVPRPAGLQDRIGPLVAKAARLQHHRQVRRRMAIAISSIAASLLLLALVKPFGRPVLDADRLASYLAQIHVQVTADDGEFRPLQPPGPDWPLVIDRAACVGSRIVELFGRSTVAYRIVHGDAVATLISLPRSDFPFQIGQPHLVTRDSTRRVEVHYLVVGDRVCVLIARDGTDVTPFFTRSSLT